MNHTTVREVICLPVCPPYERLVEMVERQREGIDKAILDYGVLAILERACQLAPKQCQLSFRTAIRVLLETGIPA